MFSCIINVVYDVGDVVASFVGDTSTSGDQYAQQVVNER